MLHHRFAKNEQEFSLVELDKFFQCPENLFYELIVGIKQRVWKVIAIHGEMGAGKTTFIRKLVTALDEDASIAVTSPTFALSHIHKLSSIALDIAHYDLYRVQNYNELEEIGIFDSEHYDLALIEWPHLAISRLKQLFNDKVLEIKIDTVAPDIRKISFVAN